MKYTKKELLINKPCPEGLLFAGKHDFNCHRIYDLCERGDWLMWLLRVSNRIDKMNAVKIAVACTKRVLIIFENDYPNDKRPRLAIKAASYWIKNPTKKNAIAASAAAAHAKIAAVGAYIAATNYAGAADAAVDVAYAASYAAVGAANTNAYTNAASAHATYVAIVTAINAVAASVADASVADAATKMIEEQRWQADKIREIVPNPFD